ncbi:hypothetical protein HK101_011766 [Irineochytrium annulatum]|nr:hypothetical protein HK101_011766 [Irineochytrium annulatum]
MEALFKSIGFSEQKAKETAANKKLSENLELLINEFGTETATKFQALFYTLASTVKDAAPHLVYIAKAIVDERLKSSDQVAAAIKFCSANAAPFDAKKFDAACGVGVVISEKDIKAAVKQLIESKGSAPDLKPGPLLAALRDTELKWAHFPLVKAEVEKQLKDLKGSSAPAPKGAKGGAKGGDTAGSAPAPKPAPPAKASVMELSRSSKFVFEGALAALHKPGENPQIDPRLMKEHLARTGGKVVTRFPPEPNGFLHIGHAKALNINFGYAAAHGGVTYLRYDDTNPEAEEEMYFDSIKDMVTWLGFTPTKITYSSDHFQRLHDLAVELIKRDKAYVCHCTGEEIHEMRGGESKGPRKECKHRSRPIEESLTEFRRMKEGFYEEGKAILRMKMDMFNPNPQFWDLVAYRVMYTEHLRTGNQWCIYPTYDYTHCLCDSFEDITHSLCTTEFQLSRPSYYWLVDALEIYKPVQWEYGRLRLTYAILSKRKLLKLVNEGYVSGWDDPRLFTLMALKRRGFTPEAISAFVRELGVTTADTVIPVERLENYVRDHLNDVAPRLMVIPDPLKVVLTNLPENHYESIEVPNKPRDDAMGSHKVPFTRVVYIDASDFRETEDPNFKRLTLGGSVGLLNVPHPITAREVVKDKDGKIVEIKAEYEDKGKGGKDGGKSKLAYIQWVAESAKDKSPVPLEIRHYNNLFLHENPMDKAKVPGGWLTDINPHSLEISKGAFAEVGVRSAKVEDKYQFLRVGYFCLDKDSDPAKGRYIFNKTVSLKEDSQK